MLVNSIPKFANGIGIGIDGIVPMTGDAIFQGGHDAGLEGEAWGRLSLLG